MYEPDSTSRGVYSLLVRIPNFSINNLDKKINFKILGFQFLYTTIFGAYSTFLFLRTGHLIAPVVAHAFCNHMGFPDIAEPLQYKGVKRCLLISSFILGLILWCSLLIPMTEPSIYYNNVFWDHNYSYVLQPWCFRCELFFVSLSHLSSKKLNYLFF